MLYSLRHDSGTRHLQAVVEWAIVVLYVLTNF